MESELAKQKWKSSYCSTHACWSWHQVSKLTNERLVLNSPWMDFSTNQFSKTLTSLEVDQSDILHISRLQRKCDFADWKKTKDTACTVLHKWQTYLVSERRVVACECAVVGEKAILIERPLSLLAGWTPTPPAFLSSSGLCSLISELESQTSAMTIFRWRNAESVQDMNLTWIQRINRFNNHWMQIISHCQRNHSGGSTIQWKKFPYTWAMVLQEKQRNLSWTAAISFSTLNCNESLSSISNEDHSKPYKDWVLTPESVLPTN